MTALTADLTLTGEIVRVDGPLTVGESYHLEDEVVVVRASVIENYADVTTGDRWRVKRGADHTTKATHASGTALTLARLYEAGGAGGGAIAVTDGSTTVADATSIEVSGATVTDGGGGIAQVDVPVQQGIEIAATGATAAEINLTTQTEDGNAAILGEAYSENSQGSVNFSAGGGNEEASLDLAASDGGGSLATLNATNIGFYGVAATPRPVVPLTTPDVQDVIDALVLLGLVTQSD